jgi:hypothetical protein
MSTRKENAPFVYPAGRDISALGASFLAGLRLNVLTSYGRICSWLFAVAPYF